MSYWVAHKNIWGIESYKEIRLNVNTKCCFVFLCCNYFIIILFSELYYLRKYSGYAVIQQGCIKLIKSDSKSFLFIKEYWKKVFLIIIS